MATYNIYVVTTGTNLDGDYNYNVSVKDSNDNDLTNTLNRLEIAQGDYVRVHWQTNSGNAPAPSYVSVQDLRSAVWTTSSDQSISPVGSYKQIQVKSAGELGHETIRIQVPDWAGSGIHDVYLDIVDDVDTVPDSFSLGLDQTNLQPNSYYYFDRINVSGINATTNVTISGTGAAFKKNASSSWVTSTTVNNGDRLYCRVLTQNDYGAANKTVTLTIGGVSDSVVIGTIAEEDIEVILFPYAQGESFGLDALGDFFGRRTYEETWTYFGDYLKGGGYVPTISPYNDDIPTSPNMELDNFGGSATTFYFEKYPPNKIDSKDTSSSAQQVRVEWFVGTDFKPGYGLGIQSTVNIRYRVDIIGNYPSELEIYPYDAEGAWSQWFNITAFPALQVSMTIPEDSEVHTHGTITIEMQHPQDPNKNQTITATANFVLDAYGP